MHPPVRFRANRPRAVPSARIASSGAASRRPFPSSLVASPVAAPREYLKYVLESHFAGFSGRLRVHASISRRKVFPKGIPVNATPGAPVYRKGRMGAWTSENDEGGVQGRQRHEKGCRSQIFLVSGVPAANLLARRPPLLDAPGGFPPTAGAFPQFPDAAAPRQAGIAPTGGAFPLAEAAFPPIPEPAPPIGRTSAPIRWASPPIAATLALPA